MSTMKRRTNFESFQDRKVADEYGVDTSLNCHANGCPNRWSIDGGEGRLCTTHSRVPMHQWGLVTQEQQHAETERARQAQRPQLVPRPVTQAEKVAILTSMQRILPKADKGWAHALKARQDAGEYLTASQRQMVRDALGVQA